MKYQKSLIAKIRKREGSLEVFNPLKIEHAVHKALIASQEGSKEKAEEITDQVLGVIKKTAQKDKSWIPDVEQIQDWVEKKLIESGLAKTAKGYILYRESHAQLRKKFGSIPSPVKKLIDQSFRYFRNTLSYVVYLRTYARWIEDEERRETWIETIERYMNFMKKQLGSRLTAKEYQQLQDAILHQEILPSMRLLQFAGKATESNHVTAYNCSYIAPTTLKDFGEIMYVSMCGCGVGFSVESSNIQSLPIIKKQTGKKIKTHVIKDTREGWCDAFILGLKTWYAGKDLEFDFSQLRPLGARLKTLGGKSSGPEPLKSLLKYSRTKILQRQGRRLTNLDAHDIICKIGEVVVSGGVRRSAMISLSDLDDISLRNAKEGPFFYKEPQRAYANNSAVYENEPNDETLLEEWLALIKSGTGERGLFNRGSIINALPLRRKKYFTKKKIIVNDRIQGFLGTNPCGEIILQSKQFCNLTEIVARAEDNEKSLLQKIYLATILGTYQATLTDFPYLSNEWKKNCDEERLLGVSITGQWDCEALRNKSTLEKLKKHAIKTNHLFAKRLGINTATAITCVKPSGTASLIVDSSSGMHPRHAPYYIRRIRIAKTDALFHLLKDQGIPYHPEVGYTEETTPTFVLEFPIKSPHHAIFRKDLSAIDQLKYWRLLKTSFTEHNPSVTISVAPNEWIQVLNWLKENWNLLGGLSFLPLFEDVYLLPPFEEISKEKYQELIERSQLIDFSKLITYEKSVGEETAVSNLQTTIGTCG